MILNFVSSHCKSKFLVVLDNKEIDLKLEFF